MELVHQLRPPELLRGVEKLAYPALQLHYLVLKTLYPTLGLRCQCLLQRPLVRARDVYLFLFQLPDAALQFTDLVVVILNHLGVRRLHLLDVIEIVFFVLPDIHNLPLQRVLLPFQGLLLHLKGFLDLL